MIVLSSKIKADFSKKHQTMESFGASGAWWSQLIGGSEIAEEIAQLLYSKEEGIGLGVYRYNLGGGSLNGGNKPFPLAERGTESFDTPNGGYDFTRDSAAVSMMKKAVKYGADEVVVFVNSPPVSMTINGKAAHDKPMTKNLSPDKYPAFAKYCLDVVEHFVDEGIPVKYISPVNEPVWIWLEGQGQEGCHYMPRDVKRLFKVFAAELNKREKLKGVMLSGAEQGDLRWFNKSYTRAILSDSTVRSKLDSSDFHSYFLHPVKPFFSDRIAYLKRFKSYNQRHFPGIKLKMTEWCHMQGGTDCSMKSAMVLANTMYEDIRYADVVSWQHWIAVSFYNYCDGIIYADREAREYKLTKRYFVTGNFSKYLVGAQRVEAHCSKDDIRCLCFTKANQVIFVVINNSHSIENIELPIKGEATMVITDESNDLTEVPLESTSHIKLTPQSVNTIIVRSDKNV